MLYNSNKSDLCHGLWNIHDMFIIDENKNTNDNNEKPISFTLKPINLNL